MKKCLILLLFLFPVEKIQSQTSWYNTYMDSATVRCVFPVGNSIVGIGTYLDYNNYVQKYYFLRTTTSGDTLVNILITDTADTGVQEGLSGLATYDNKVILSGFSAPINFGYELRLIQLDTMGNILWRRTFPNTYGTATLNYIKIISTPDSGFALFGEANYSGYFIKTDKFGNQQFRHDYGNNFMYITDAVYNDDGTFTMVGQNEINSILSTFILKVDSLGNIIWSQTYSNGLDSFYSICRHANSYYVGSTVGNFMHIQKLSSAGVILNSFNLNKYGGLYTVKVDDNNQIYGCGAIYNSTFDSAYFVIVDTLGTVIFDRTWGSDITPGDQAYSCYQDVGSGYVIAGNADNKSFITKIDSLGQTTYLVNIADQTSNAILYPNPSPDGYYQLEIKKEILGIYITDLLGKEIKHNFTEDTNYHKSFNLKAGSGVYLLTIFYKNGSSETMRLMK